ncbi:Membrane-associated protein gex-3 family protein [Onchocerca flexuosa]|uniref:Membrane-associated protein gex-3 family protein n=2 Tax=Onchocerca flexuosa TaxID=387005 RepID=A0A238BZY4_9BILA|nr:Membrane-associated protein gex-3 family protein [Onchocerca flexuosa]
MAYKIDVTQMKIAEKLIILNDRAVGMLTRLYNIKKACGDSKSKPQFLSEKSLESCIKHIVRKFPIVDARSSNTLFHQVSLIKQEILKSLSLYYCTFADLLDLKDHILQLLTTMDAAQFKLDITTSYDLTAGYMNLVINLVCLMVLLSRVDDKKAVLGLFNAAYELSNGQSEPTFPRLGQMIIEYDNPWKKLAEDLGPLNRLIHGSLTSLGTVYVRRNITADAWRNAQMLSLVASPQQILYAAQTDTIACEYLSLDVMDRWIILGVLVCHNTLLNDSVIANLWQRALQTGLAIRLFRDEILIVHQTVQSVFENAKNYSKKLQEVKDHYSVALQTSLTVHRDRRRFLRGTLRELCLLIKDQVGLLGPKILFVWMALSFSRDEVTWLLRHVDIWPVSSSKKTKYADEVADKQLPELLHYILELRSLVKKHDGVIKRYYSQYVTGYDALILTDIMQSLENLGEKESVLLSDFCADLSHISQDSIDLRSLRLDWFRFQAYVSMSRSSFTFNHDRRLAVTMNTTVFHLKMIDLIDEMLRETSDLSIYCFYAQQFETQLHQCLQLPSQSRYTVSFAHICSNFPSALHDLCPEEKAHIIDRSLKLCNLVLDELAKETASVAARLCEYEVQLTEQLSPSNCARLIEEHDKQKSNKNSNTARSLVMPGEESFRCSRDALTLADKLQTALHELCSAVTSSRQVIVSGHIFAPREYLAQQLESQLTQSIQTLISSSEHPMRPCQLLASINAHMIVLQNLDTIVTLDMTRLFNSVLLQQTQYQDYHGNDTLTSIYTKWYLEVVLRRMSTGQILFSPHFAALIANPDYQQTFSPDQYTDNRELRALSLLLGPYGVKTMSEKLIWHVASQITELNKIVNDHRDALILARSCFDKPEKMRELLMQLSGDIKDRKQISINGPMESVLQRVTIIGEILSFRSLLHAALHDVLKRRLPFLLSIVNDLHDTSNEHNLLVLSELCMAVGINTDVDVALVHAIRAQMKQTEPDEHYTLSCLLLVFIALSLPRLALTQNSQYSASLLAFFALNLLAASKNNLQCIALAVSTVANALFCLHGRNDVTERMKEFLALASNGLLRTSEDSSDVDTAKSRQFVYVVLDQLVKHSPLLSFDLLESCFPYNLIRSSYQYCYHLEELK